MSIAASRSHGVLLLLLSMQLIVGGCRKDCSGTQRLTRGDATLIYNPSIDRVVHYSAGSGNVIHLSPDLYHPDPQANYVFRGGAYTWIAPQAEWINAKGETKDWPPDPAMDRGPTSADPSSTNAMRVIGPNDRRGIREEKRWEIHGDGSVTFEMKLLPAGDATHPASAWSTTAGLLDSIIAIPSGPLRFSSEAFENAWNSAATQRDGWILIDTKKLMADGKVFANVRPIVAAWKDGQWFVRSGDDATSPRHPSDAPVELYINNKIDLIELELIGPYRPVTRDGQNRWREHWRIIPSAQPDPTVIKPLPEDNVLFQDIFKDLDEWHLEGLVQSATLTDKGELRLACEGSRQGYEGVMAFCKRDFPDNIRIEYDLVVENHNGLFITFIGMKGVNGEDAITGVPPRTGVFEDYTGKNSTTRSYHVSICRYNDESVHTGVSNWRRNPGLRLMTSGKDLCTEIGETYHVRITKRGASCMVEVNGELGAHFVDPKKAPDPIPTDGKVGFRAIGSKAVFRVSNFRVSKAEQ